MLSRSALATTLAVVVGGVLLTTGCVPVAPLPTPSASPDASASPTPSSSATPTPSPTPSEAPSRPVSIACDQLITLQAMYDFNPNYGLLGPLDASAGSLAADAIALQGVACRWVHTSSGATLDVSVADLSTALLDEKRAAAGDAVDGFGAEGYFRQGEAQAISGSYWIALVSEDLFEAASAAPLMAAAVAAVG